MKLMQFVQQHKLTGRLKQGSHSNDVSKFQAFQHHKHQKIRPTVLPLTTFYVVLIRKHGSENVSWNIFCWFIIIINAGKLNCKNYSITDLVFQEHTSQIWDFFSTSVQFQDFSGPEKSKLKFQYFSGPVGTLLKTVQYVHHPIPLQKWSLDATVQWHDWWNLGLGHFSCVTQAIAPVSSIFLITLSWWSLMTIRFE